MRNVLAILAPLLAPTLIYIYFKTRSGDSIQIAARNAPWVWLGLGGVVLAAVVLSFLALTSGGPEDSVYAPARFEDGRVVPGRLEPEGGAAEGG